MEQLRAAASDLPRHARLRDLDLAELVPYIDWTPFFATWELKGSYPILLDDETLGEAARPLFDDAQAMLKQIVAENWFAPTASSASCRPTPSATTSGSMPTRRAPASAHASSRSASRWPESDGNHNVALSDFVAPIDTGLPDYVGGFG